MIEKYRVDSDEKDTVMSVQLFPHHNIPLVGRRYVRLALTGNYFVRLGGVVRVSSSVGAAQTAVSGFLEIDVSGEGQQVSLSASNVAGMEAGVRAANRVLKHVVGGVSGVKEQAEGVVELASGISDRDKRDAVMWV